jgi:serine O-acetyltransferase
VLLHTDIVRVEPLSRPGARLMISPLILHRLAHWLHGHGIRLIPGLIYRINYGLTGCDIAPAARVGRNVHIPHFGSGVVVHPMVTIEDEVWILPHVLLGQNVTGNGGVPESMRITVRRGAMLGAGAKVIGSGIIEIGQGASIGANAVVLHSVPAGATAVGIPARIIEKAATPPPPAASFTDQGGAEQTTAKEPVRS